MRRVAAKVDVEELKELYTKKVSLKNIAKQVGIGHSSVRRLLKEAGVEIQKPRGPSKAISRVQLVELYIDRQLSMNDVAKELGIHQTTVYDKLIDNDIPIRTIKEGERLAKLQGKMKRSCFERVLTADGYYQVKRPAHTRATAAGYVKEHLLIWEEAHGELPSGWIIHHINGKTTDNRVCNLHAFGSANAHSLFHGYARRQSSNRYCPRHLLRGYLHDWLQP